MAATKEHRLLELRRRIIDDLYAREWREVWFFPTFLGVKGWRGAADIVFASLNPSTGHFPGMSDRLFYAELARNGFQDAHLTDVLKERAPGKESALLVRDDSRMRQHRRYFLEELSIVEPRMVVPVGRMAAHGKAARWGVQTGRNAGIRWLAAGPTRPPRM